MEHRTRFEASMDKKQAMREADASGQVADSMAVRMALMDRVDSGEISLEQAQSELAKIKRNAKNNGKVTRAQAYARG